MIDLLNQYWIDTHPKHQSGKYTPADGWKIITDSGHPVAHGLDIEVADRIVREHNQKIWEAQQ